MPTANYIRCDGRLEKVPETFRNFQDRLEKLPGSEIGNLRDSSRPQKSSKSQLSRTST